MKSERIIEGLNAVIEGVTILRDELKKEVDFSKSEPVMNEPVKEEVKPEVVEEVVEDTTEKRFTEEQLKAMKFNDLKKLGASVGVSCKGTRDEIIERMLNIPVDEEVEEETEEVTEEVNDKVVPISKAKKGIKKAEKEEEPEEEVDEELIQLATEVTEDMTAKDIIEYLAEFDIKAKGKKSDVIKVLAKAIADGIVQIEDDDEEDVEEEELEVIEAEEVEEFNENSYFADYDLEGANDPEGMTEERLDAVTTLMADIIEGVENDSITEEDIQTFIETFATEEEIDLLGDDYEFEDLVALYCEIKKRFIDDEGEEHESEDPYEISEENFCCGHKLKYEKKSKKFICEICGEEYEAE